MPHTHRSCHTKPHMLLPPSLPPHLPWPHTPSHPHSLTHTSDVSRSKMPAGSTLIALTAQHMPAVCISVHMHVPHARAPCTCTCAPCLSLSLSAYARTMLACAHVHVPSLLYIIQDLGFRL